MDKGKNFSRNRPRADREDSDLYQTAPCLTQAIIDAHIKPYWNTKNICDFCSGLGAMQMVLEKNGYTVPNSDIMSGQNFFDIGKGSAEYGVMNPPFRLFNEWVQHCFEVFSVSFALLAPTTYLQGVKRYNNQYKDGIFQNTEYPLTHIYTFNRYPMLSVDLRPDGLIETGMQALSWFVWSKRGEVAGYNSDTIHRWLDIDGFVWRKGRKRK